MSARMGEFEGREGGDFGGGIRPAQAMMLPRRRGGRGLKLLVILLLLVVIALGAYIAIDKTTPGGFLLANKVSENVNQEKDDIEEAEEVQVKGEKTGYAVSNEIGTLYLTKGGAVYYEPTSETQFSIGEVKGLNAEFEDGYVPGVVGKYALTRDDLAEGIYEPLAEKEFYPHSFTGYKLDLENVTILAKAEWGQAFDGYYYLFVDDDGRMSALYLRPGGLTDGAVKARAKFVKNVEGFENVASIQGINMGDGLGVVAIFKDGGQKVVNLETMIDRSSLLD